MHRASRSRRPLEPPGPHLALSRGAARPQGPGARRASLLIPSLPRGLLRPQVCGCGVGPPGHWTSRVHWTRGRGVGGRTAERERVPRRFWGCPAPGPLVDSPGARRGVAPGVRWRRASRSAVVLLPAGPLAESLAGAPRPAGQCNFLFPGSWGCCNPDACHN